MPLIIITTFILFHAIPSGILIFVYNYREGQHAEKRSQHIGYGICSLLPGVGSVTDVVMYILLTPRYKMSIMKLCGRQIDKKSNVQSWVIG